MIHPFRDGNGRTCRLICDYILTAMGYPPVIVATDDQTRSSYYNTLCLGETNNRGGWIRPFILFMLEQVRRAIQVVTFLAHGYGYFVVSTLIFIGLD